jgi:hypothetical protein
MAPQASRLSMRMTGRMPVPPAIPKLGDCFAPLAMTLFPACDLTPKPTTAVFDPTEICPCLQQACSLSGPNAVSCFPVFPLLA